MKRYKFLSIVIVTIPAIMTMMGCATSSATSLALETQSVQQANIGKDDILESKDICNSRFVS